MVDFAGVVRISRTPQGMLFQCEFTAKANQQCVRCLTDFWEPLHTNFSELYAFTDRTASESDLLIPEDANVDLADLVREYMLIEVPINPICRVDCKGLCPECGADWNTEQCEHVKAGEQASG